MSNKKDRIRKPVVAGMFYPADSGELKDMIDDLLDASVKQKLAPPKAIIVPHAGYPFSGQTAAQGFKQLEDFDYQRVILIGPSHQEYFAGASVVNADAYQTPLGKVIIDKKITEVLKHENFIQHESAHEREHALEVELPFLQRVINDFELMPFLIGSGTSFAQLEAISAELEKYMDEKTLLVVSSDFTHYGPNYGYVPFTENHKENIAKIDQKAFTYIENKDAKGFYDYVRDSDVTIDGGTVIPVALLMAKKWSVNHLDYTTSGAMMGDYENSVSYASFGFWEASDLDFTEKQKGYLLKLARESLEASVQGGLLPDIDQPLARNHEDYARLQAKQGVFVTLTKSEQLRGCIGYILPQKSIIASVIENAKNAAMEDPRFPSVKPEELRKISVEVSILSVPTLLHGTPEEKLARLRPGVDGLVLQNEFYQSTYLPQVWEQIGGKEEFLSSLCEKAGLPFGAWKDENTRWYTYQAEHFSE